MNNLTLALAALVVILFLVLMATLWRCRSLANKLDSLEFQNRSLSTTYGQITEQWFPLMETYPYDPQHFRFLGSPIDGVQFEEDRIVFVEFKTNRARLSKRQQHLRDLIEAGEVYWEEFRFTSSGE